VSTPSTFPGCAAFAQYERSEFNQFLHLPL